MPGPGCALGMRRAPPVWPGRRGQLAGLDQGRADGPKTQGDTVVLAVGAGASLGEGAPAPPLGAPCWLCPVLRGSGPSFRLPSRAVSPSWRAEPAVGVRGVCLGRPVPGLPPRPPRLGLGHWPTVACALVSPWGLPPSWGRTALKGGICL